MEASGITVQDIMFKSSLILGLIQMLFGMFLRAAKEIKQAGILHAVSTLGWAFSNHSFCCKLFVGWQNEC